MTDEQRPLARGIEAQNALAAQTPAKPGPPMETVRVLQRAVFNGPNHKSIGWRDTGDIIEVAAGAYAAGLIAAGLVERYVAAEPVESTEAVPPPTVAPRHAQQQRASKPRRSK